MDHTDPKYKRWIEYREKYKEPPMTNTQWRFAMWLFENQDNIVALGNLTDVFNSVRGFVKEDVKKEDSVDKL